MLTKVSFIGAGNLAWHLAPALDNIGYQVREVYTRDPTSAKKLIGRLYHARYVDHLDFRESDSKLFLIAVSDDAIQTISKDIILPDDAIIVHVSGSVPMEVLSFSAAPNYGVLYPLQTFSTERKTHWPDLPLFVEASNDYTADILLSLGKGLTGNVRMLDSDRRRALHLAAVFANNFINHMIRISVDITKAHNIPFEVLQPLLAETFNKAMDLHPENAQTGPAKRHDYAILDSHLQQLEDSGSLGEVYRIISRHIAETYPNNFS